jgi:lipoprotein-releasing system permease protein
LYKLYLALHYLRTRLIAYFAICAVALCVMMVLVVMSVMGGWLEQVKKRARGLLGDVIVDNRAFAGFPLYEEFIARISTWPEVERATPVLYSLGLMRVEARRTEQTNLVSIVGVRLEEIVHVNAFREGLFYETYYPGTTHLGPQKKPLFGVDPAAEPLVTRDGRRVLPFRLPEPYQSALERARAEYRERTGRELEAADAVDGPLNRLLRESGLPTIPGEWSFNEHFEIAEQVPALAGEEYPGIIIGRDILARRHSDGRYERYYDKGQEVVLTYWAASTRGQVDPTPRKMKFRYVDDSRTGVFEIDSRHVYVDFDLLQKLLEMDAAERVDVEGRVIGRVPPRCSQIQIRTRPHLTGEQLQALCRRMTETYRAMADDPSYDLDSSERRLVGRVEALTWEQSQAHIIAPVEKEKVLVTILFGIISMVAVVLILCILYMIVLQKTRDIGIVKAIGGSSFGVALIFVFYGAAVGVIGSAIGAIGGTYFVWHINDVQDWLISIDPRLRVWDLSVYSFDRIPQEVNPRDLVVIVAIAIAAATLGSLAAAWRAGSMHPVDAIRYE